MPDPRLMFQPVIVPLLPEHWPDISRVYAEGIATGNATFEKVVPTWAQWDAARLAGPRLGAIVDRRLQGWAALSPVSARAVYAGVAEVGLYVGASARGQGVGRALLGALVQASEASGLWTLQAGIFPENHASVAIHVAASFRHVGVRERLGQQDGRWRDVLLLERRSALVGVVPEPPLA